jgi:non-ribosomal peptide synthetase component F
MRIVVDWNRTDADYPTGLRLDSAYGAQVCRTPDSCALIDAGQPMTYAELDRRANCIAHALIGRDIANAAPIGGRAGRHLSL